jgi:anti-sigma regulatory factor (Ser/Thr protein kinase)
MLMAETTGRPLLAGEGPMERHFPARASTLPGVRAFIRNLSHRARLSHDTANDLVLAVSEACSNAVRHSGASTIGVRWTHAADRVEVLVEDGGVFMPVSRRPRTDGGYGIGIMTALVDEFEIREGKEGSPGTTVRLVKYEKQPRRRIPVWQGPAGSAHRAHAAMRRG